MKKEYDKKDLASKMLLLWNPLNNAQRARFVRELSIRQYAKDEIVFSENDTPHHLFFLFKGKVKIYKEGIGGRQQILRLIRPDTCFGFRPYFLGESYKTSGAANEECQMGLLPMDFIRQMVVENGRFALMFIEQLSSALGMADTYMVNMTQKHVRGRLAEALLRLKESYGTTDDGQTLDLYISREDLARMSNMTTSNAIRTLSTFASEDIIATEGKKIKILQEEQLQLISRMG